MKKNKNKIRSPVNAILDKFLKETVTTNIILLTKTREVMAKKSGTTNYSNHDLIVNNIIDISKSIQLLVKDRVFEKQLCQKYEVKTSDQFAL